MRLHTGARLILEQRREICANPIDLDAWFTPPDDLQPPVGCVVQPGAVRAEPMVEVQWKQNVLKLGRDSLSAGECLRRHANDGDGAASSDN